jgi:hypothetical protein
MKLTLEQTRDIANYLDDKVSNHFHDAIINSIGYGVEVSDEDIIRIKEQLKLIL